MRNENKLLFLICMLLLSSFPLLVSAADIYLEGTVNDLGAANSANKGIASVWITVKNTKNMEVANGLTNARGSYRIALPTPDNTVFAYYEKLGFQPRPTIRSITDIKKKQEAVFLVREDASSAYYKESAKNISDAATTLSLPEMDERVYLVVSLPQPVRSQVTEQLKELAASDVLNKIQVGENIDMKLKTRLSENANLKSYIIADTIGETVKLNGSVLTVDEKAKAGEIAKSVKGVANVENHLNVMERLQ
jgi:hypothetical protein